MLHYRVTIPFLAVLCVTLKHIRTEFSYLFYVTTELQSLIVQRTMLVHVQINIDTQVELLARTDTDMTYLGRNEKVSGVVF